MRYRFYTTGNKVICVSSYAGKTVRAVAVCSPEDEFDLEKGKALAQARCDVKIAEKRLKRARQAHHEAAVWVETADNYCAKMTSYYSDSLSEVIATKEALNKLEGSM